SCACAISIPFTSTGVIAKGRDSNERIWSVIGTCALQGRSAFNFILEAVTAYFNNEPSPSLIFDTS
ncbi:MAG: hypothetical protein HQK65_10290, partial [Desulfamplus sp.]|nr:hypothetical protein [Desulfamplus sp.]